MSTPWFELTLEFQRKLDYLRLATAVSRLVSEAAAREDLPGSLVDDVELAVSEACTNAIKHSARAGGTARVVLRFRVYEGELVIEVSDRGEGFDIEKVPLPEFDRHPEGGYGLYIIRTVMDEVRYTAAAGVNTLTMKKRLKRPR
ncbi:MAG TPA: ATP-binding protein [Syntrophobacteraceae bacterium]|nr:ATP-binding protein [Syntrophobacteraceae bacterium]